jgi:hypothetical protein
MAFKDDIKMSIYKLDEAALNQAELYEEWSTKWAQAISERDKLKEQITIFKAEVDERIRLHPQKYGWASDKAPTETWIAQKIILDPELRELNNKFIEAQYNVNIMASAKETLEHRKKGLDILTDLYKGNYFVAKSRTGENYTETLTRKNTEAQSDHLDNDERMKRRRRVGNE